MYIKGVNEVQIEVRFLRNFDIVKTKDAYDPNNKFQC